jgi:16S rRNA (uracil1498-N3)-methyltransferase
MRQLCAYECHASQFNRRLERTMRITRVYVENELNSGGTVELARDTASHLAKVLRARGGEELLLFNGDGREFAATIELVRGSHVSVLVGAALTVNRESPLRVTLLQCVPRGDRMDFIVQKATELGVARIVPVLSQRSVVRLDHSQAASKRLHWQAVAVSACEQCGRTRLPQIETAQPLLHYLGALPPMDSSAPAVRLVLEPEATHPLLDSGAIITAAEFAIGPEGGFAADELEAFQLSGFSRLGLGPRILRTETAAVAALIMLQTRFGDMCVAR